MKRILIVEDEVPLREAFEFLLKSEGYIVDCVGDGSQALVSLKKSTPDLILLDMLMPVMDGLEFLQKARLPKEYPDVRVILLSNLSDNLTLDDEQALGVDESILKAKLSPVELAQVVEKHLKPRKENSGRHTSRRR